MRFLISQNAAPDEGGTLSLDVATGSISGGTVVTVTASAGGLVPGITGTLGGVDVGTVSWIDSHHVSFETPINSAGAKTLILSNPDGETATKTNAFTYQLIVSSLDVTTGSAAGGGTITVTGLGYQAGEPTVKFGTTVAADVSVISDTELTCTLPGHAAGTVDVSVTIGTSVGTKANAFTYNVVVSSVSASSGDDFSTQSVTINGAGYTQTPSAVTFGGVSAGSIARVSDTQVTCTVPAKVVSSGSSVEVDVVVTVNGHSGTGTNAYTYKLTPWSLSPELWHRADLGVSLVGGNVTSWANQGTAAADSNTNFSDVGNSAFRPTFIANDADFNGGPSFSFTTNSNQLRTGTLAAPITTPQTYVVVGKKSATSTDGTVYLGLLATSNIWAYKNASDANLYALDTAAANIGAHNIFILIVTFDGASSTWMLNSTTSNTVNLGAGHTVNSLKCFAGNGGNNGSKGVETVVKAGAMPLADRQRLMVALGAKHGVAIS